MSKHFIFGLHAVLALLQKKPERIEKLCLSHDRHDKKIAQIVSLAKAAHIAIEYVSKADLDRMTQDANHQGVVAFSARVEAPHEGDLVSFLQNLDRPAFLLILDGVQDPHNLGACFRSADAAGVHAIIAPKDKAASITPIVSKVASGAAETVPFFQVTNLARTLEELKELGIWIYGAAAEGAEVIYNVDFKGPIALVMGAEGSGLRRLTREHCDGLIQIPMHGSVSSLNVSVATGIALFEVVRQRLN